MSRLSPACPHCHAPLTTPPQAGPVPCPACGKTLAPDPPPPRWFYIRAKKKVGPAPLTELRALAEAGELRPNDMVLPEGARQWVAAASVPGLFAPPVPVPAAAPDPQPVEPSPEAPGIRTGVPPLVRSGSPTPPGEEAGGEDADDAGEGYASWVAALDDALAGKVPQAPLPGMDAVPAGAERDLACLVLLRQCWPGRQQPDVTPPDEDAGSPAGPPTPLVQRVGRFEVRRELGRGAFGCVFLAYDPELRREVALKVPHAEVLPQPEMRQRFQREARAAAGLDHPNIVPVYEAGEAGPVCYMASAYCPGVTLAAWLRQRTEPVPAEVAARLLVPLAEAVAHAHSRGVLHRDLKPANILLDAAEQPHVTDFGLAKLSAEEALSLTQSGAIVGTPAYMAPEQAGDKSKEIGPHTDVYALGVILYELLTSRPPFQADDVLEMLVQVRVQEPVPPRRLRPRLPRDLETICLKCLQKEPHRRYATGTDLADDLRRFLDKRPIRARPVGALEHAVKWARRRPAVAGLIAAVLLIGTVGLAGILWNWRAAVAAQGRADQKAQVATEALGRETEALAKETEAKEAAQRARTKAEEAQKETSAKNEQLRRQAYVVSVRGAATALTNNDVPKAEELLHACPPALRGWEWHHLLRQCRAALFTVSSAHGVAFRPDGKLLTFSFGIKMYDAETGRQVGALPVPTDVSDGVRLAVSPDGKRLALPVSGTEPKKIEAVVWDLKTGKRVRTFTDFKTELVAVAFSPDGSRLVTCGGDSSGDEKDRPSGELKVWDIDTGRLVLDIKEIQAAVQDVCFSPDGRQLASAGMDGKVRLWDAVTGKELRAFSGHEGAVNAVAFSPDGQYLASGSDDRNVRIWATGGDYSVVCRGHADRVSAVAFSPDGLRVGSGGGDRAVKVWNVSGREWATYRGHEEGVTSLAFSPDGARLASADRDTIKEWDAIVPPGSACAPLGDSSAVAFSPDGERLVMGSLTLTGTGVLRVLDRATGRLALTAQGHNDGVWALAFRPDGKELASAGDEVTPAGRAGSVRLWDAATGRLLRALPFQARVDAVRYSPDGSRLAIRTRRDRGDSTVRVLEAATGREVFSRRSSATAAGLTFSPDGQRLAVAGDPDHPELVNIVDLTTSTEGRQAGRRPVVTLTGHNWTVIDLAWHRDRIATLSSDGSVKVWDAATGEPQLTLPLHERGQPSSGIAFSPDGSRLAAAVNGRGRVWELTEGKEVLAIPARTPGFQRVVAFSPDGRYLTMPGGSPGGESVVVLDGGRGPLALSLCGQDETGSSPAVAFSPDGQLLAGGKTRASLWNAATGEELAPMPGFRNTIGTLAFSPDSRLLVAGTFAPSRPRAPGEVKVWDVARRKEVLTFRGHAAGIRDVAVSPDGRRIASTSEDRTVKVWEPRTGRVELTLRTTARDGFSGVAFSPDGTRLATADRRVRVWEATSGRQVVVCTPRGAEEFYAKVAFSPDGKYLVAGGQAVTVWDALTGQEVRTLEGSVNSPGLVAFSRDGKLLAAAGFWGGVTVWDFASGREVLSCPARGNTIYSLAFSPDGRRLAVGDGKSLDVWEVGKEWQALEAARRRDEAERATVWHRQRAADVWGFTARFHSSWLIAREPNEGRHYASRADANVESGRWEEAAADVARAVELLPDDVVSWWRKALLHLRAGSAAPYRQTCEALFQRLGRTTDPATAAGVVWICCLAPGATDNPKGVVELAERAVANEAGSFELATLGAALCRAGRHDEAVTRLREAIKTQQSGGLPEVWFLLALAHRHLNQPDKAREALEQGRAQQKKLGRQNWQSRLGADLLRAEAEKLLEEKKP
jgi:WD40 repeat protein/tetratricopeptide (TPR) repeat protein